MCVEVESRFLHPESFLSGKGQELFPAVRTQALIGMAIKCKNKMEQNLGLKGDPDRVPFICFSHLSNTFNRESVTMVLRKLAVVSEASNGFDCDQE